MNPYGYFAGCYDLLMQDVDYRKIAGHLLRLFQVHGIAPKIVADLACGTGSVSVALANAGLEVIGVDRSPQMLSQAAEKAGSTNGKVMFICQDMSCLDLYGTVDAAVCTLDGINHVTDPAKAARAFQRVSLFLNPEGLFIFDLNTPYKIADIFGNNVYVYDYDRIYCVWQNDYHAKTRLCRFSLTFFEDSGNGYIRHDEHFSERAYTTKQVRNMLAKAGLTLEAAYDGMGFDRPTEKSRRIVYVARKRCD